MDSIKNVSGIDQKRQYMPAADNWFLEIVRGVVHGPQSTLYYIQISKYIMYVAQLFGSTFT